MGRSYSSDSDDEKRKKKKSRRSRSRTPSSNQRRSRRSHSRSSSHDRRKKSRRSRSRSLSYDRRKKSHRSPSQSSSCDQSKKYEVNKESLRQRSKDQFSSSRDKNDLRSKDNTAADLKEKIRSKTTTPKETIYKPSEEEIMKIEEGGFVQEHFSKTYNQDNPVQSAKSKKKKKKKQQQKQLLSVGKSNSSEVETPISHDCLLYTSPSPRDS